MEEQYRYQRKSTEEIARILFTEEDISKLPRGIATQQIKADLLPLFEQAATQTGYKVTVIARAGEKYDHDTGRAVPTGSSERIILVTDGFIGISIAKPLEQKDHTPFWTAYDALKAASVAQKG